MYPYQLRPVTIQSFKIEKLNNNNNNKRKKKRERIIVIHSYYEIDGVHLMGILFFYFCLHFILDPEIQNLALFKRKGLKDINIKFKRERERERKKNPMKIQFNQNKQ